MKHGFLILTHFPPEKIYNQIRRLQSPGHYFFIHFDKKQNIDITNHFYKELAAMDNVTIVTERINVRWGSVMMLNATLELIRYALKRTDIGYMHLLSGECLHVKSIKYIHDFFEKNKGKEFIDQFLMPVKSKDHGLTYKRIDKYHLYNFFDFKSKKMKDVVIRNINSLFRKLQRGLKLIGIYRRYSSKLPVLYAGSQWWSLSSAACKYCIDYLDSNPEFYNRIKYSQIPDEFVFQTIIMNSSFRENVAGDNLRFIDFIGATSHPHELTMKYIPGLAKENKLFARKFTAASNELLEYLDKNVY